jgi:Icc-related predicted phosphoesterase
MQITCISDLHGELPILIGGELLIIAGDFTRTGHLSEYFNFFFWVSRQNYNKVVLVAGNHDGLFMDEDWLPNKIADFEYLCDSYTHYKGFKIWGSPWVTEFERMHPGARAFAYSEEEIAKKFDKIDEDIDILVTHSPPYGILDKIKDGETGKMVSVGSRSLLAKVKKCANLQLHVFGHIHEHGSKKSGNRAKGPVFVNAAIVDENLERIHRPVMDFEF